MIYTSESIKLCEEIVASQSPFLNNDIQIRSSNIELELTEEEQIIMDTCEVDIVYFVENFCKIKENNLKLHGYQEDLLKTLTTKNVKMLTSKQIGINTMLSCFILHSLIFDKSVLYDSPKPEDKKYIIENVMNLYRKLPYYMKFGIDSITDTNINGEYATFTTDVNETIKHFHSIDTIIVDSAAYYDVCDKFYNLVSGEYLYCTKLIVNSTGNSGCYYTSFMYSDNDLHKIILDYAQVSGRGNYWVKNIINEIGEDKFNEYYDVYVSTNKLFVVCECKNCQNLNKIKSDNFEKTLESLKDNSSIESLMGALKDSTTNKYFYDEKAINNFIENNSVECENCNECKSCEDCGSCFDKCECECDCQNYSEKNISDEEIINEVITEENAKEVLEYVIEYLGQLEDLVLKLKSITDVLRTKIK